MVVTANAGIAENVATALTAAARIGGVMSMGMGLTLLELEGEVGFYCGYGRSGFSDGQLANITAFIKGGLRTFYTVHEWRFLTPKSSLTLTAPYSTGTVTIVNGVVTLSGGTFPSNAAAADFTFAGGNQTYGVASRDSNTQITLVDLTLNAAAGTEYLLAFAVYDLPADFAEITGGDITFAPGVASRATPIRVTKESLIRQRRQYNPETGFPRLCAYRPKAFSGATGQRYEIMFYPAPDAAYALEVSYRVTPAFPEDDDEEFAGGAEHSDTIVAACLAAAESRINDGQQIWQAKFNELVGKSIQRDLERHSPEYLISQEVLDCDFHSRHRNGMSTGRMRFDGEFIV